MSRRGRAAIAHSHGELIAIFLGGVLGTLARAALEESIAWHPGAWPWATLIANLVGAALIGFAAVRLGGRVNPPLRMQAFVGAGVCGGMTTFSTLAVQLVRMAQHSLWATAASYLAVSLVLGYAAVVAGMALAGRAAQR